MIKQLFLAFLLYSIIWWILFTIHFDYINKREDKDYKRDGINGYANSLLYFILFSVIYVIIQTMLESDNKNENSIENTDTTELGKNNMDSNLEFETEASTPLEAEIDANE